MRALSSLSNRIFLASAVVAVLSIGTAVFLVNVAVTRRAEAELERSVTEAGELVAQFQTLLFEHLVREARLIADLPRLKAAVYDDHAPTAQAVAEEYARQIEADLFVVTNRSGRLLAAIGDPGVSSEDIAGLQGVREALAGRPVVGFWSRADGLLPVVSTPIVIGPGQPEILGSVSVGVGLSQRLAERIKGLTRSEVVFMGEGRVQGSTLTSEHHAVLTRTFATPGASRIVLGGEEYQAAWRPLTLTAGDGTPSSAAPAEAMAMDTRGGARAPTIIALRSRTAELAFLRTLHTAFALTALGGVLLATLLSYAIARTTTRPIRALTATMGEIASTGDLTPVPPAPTPTRWEDEDARLLTGAFHTLTESLARFQREAAQRERLSSLGRLSTVLAHEIRNPLTIVKASLRTLRRGTRPEDAGALHAIADIEGEVARLNRLVNDVLDYARPIRFSIGRVDLGRLVHDAANAVLASQLGPEIRVEPPAETVEIDTDGDRLRQALVNVLSNARDAVLERDWFDQAAIDEGGHREGASTQSPIVVTTTADGETARIVVRDAGIGIAAGELARIFEPFFTTKKAGSGIGLAITKNVVEGLGGSITVESVSQQGTTVRLTMPRVPVVVPDAVALGSDRPPASKL